MRIKLRLSLSLLAVCFGFPAAAGEPPSSAPAAVDSAFLAQWLSGTFGAQGLELLKDKGYVVLQGSKPAYRLKYVQWRALEDLAGHSEAAIYLAESYLQFRTGKPAPEGDALYFLSLLELPPSGLMTPALHALVTSLAALHDQEAQLPKTAAAGGEALLFETRWGGQFADRTHADVAGDEAPLAKGFFDEYLTGVRPEAQAVGHFTDYIAKNYGADAAALLSQDARRGVLSDELRAQLTRYLGDQRRLYARKRIRAGVEALDKRTRLGKDLSDLESVARAFSAKPGLVAALKNLAAGATSPKGGPRLTSSGLHLEQLKDMPQYELGDSVILSGAYWVDGLGPKETADIEETSFIEYPNEAAGGQSAVVKRANGGPYTFSRKIDLKDSRGFFFRAIVSSALGNTLSERLWVAVSKDYESALLKLAQGDNQALSCDFKGAEASYRGLEAGVSFAASRKPQYRELLARLAQRKTRLAQEAQTLAKLEDLISESRSDSSAELCRYQTLRTENAIKLAKSLPAGCGKYLPGLNRQLAAIRRRASDQDSFAQDLAKSRQRRASCDFAGAADSAAGALAILDADPAARCGSIEIQARGLEAELPQMRAETTWKTRFSDALNRITASPLTPEARLRASRALIARMGSVATASCIADELKKAEALALSAGQSLPAPEFGAASRLVGADGGLSDSETAVALERQKLEEAARTLRERKAAEQAPEAVLSQRPQTQAPVAVPSETAGADPAKVSPARRASQPGSRPKIKSKRGAKATKKKAKKIVSEEAQ